MKTPDNLMAAFAGESQANRRYLAYALRADKDGFKNVARVIRAIAEAETVHALKHLEVAGVVKSTADNLAAAEQGEHYEFTEMYPEFIATAREENQTQAQRSFEFANKAEMVHGRTFGELSAAVGKGQDIAEAPVSMCPVCGWVGVGPPPDRCPICGAMARSFRTF